LVLAFYRGIQVAMKSQQEDNLAHKGRKQQSAKLQIKAREISSSMRQKPERLDPKNVEQFISELQVYLSELETLTGDLNKERGLLEESREKYFQLYDLAPVGYVMMDTNCIITEANLTFSELVGIEKSKLKNQRFAQFVAPDYRDIFHSHCSELVESGTSRSCELRLRGMDGREFWVNLESSVEKEGIDNVAEIRTTLTDITEQKKRTEVEHILTNIMRNSPDAITLQDFSGNIISWNRGAKEMYGYTSEEALKMKIDRLLPEDRKVEMNNLRVVLQSRGKIETLETKRVSKEGKILDIWLTISVFSDPFGRPAGFLTIERDITERKKEEIERKRLLSQLTSQRLMLEAILDQSPLGIMIAEPSGKVILQSNMMNKIFKVEVADARDFSDYGKVRKILHDDGTAYKPEDFPLYRVLKKGEIIIGEVAAFKRGDGSIGTIEMHAAPVQNEEGEIIAGVVILQDITHDIEYENKLKESRDFAENIIASICDGILVLDDNLEIVRCNLPYCKLFDVPVKKILKRSIFEIQGAVWDEPAVRRAIDSLSEDLEEFDDLEVEKEFPRIGKRVIVINGRPVLGSDGVANLILLSFRDISEYRTAKNEIERLNTALMRHNVALQEANKELEAFTYSVSHDLRAPLRAIEGFSQILLEEYREKFDDKAKHYLDRITSGTATMSELINDLLRLSRISRAIMKEEAISLSNKAERIAEELKKLDPERNVEFLIEKNLSAEGDRKLIYQVIENLMQNAWKFTKENENAKIEFGSLQKDDHTVYYVRDNGAGFDMEYVNKLFQPFQRLHTSSEFSGTGIGLSIVERIIRRHGGKVWAEGKEGKGATFYFTLQSGERDENHAAKNLTG